MHEHGFSSRFAGHCHSSHLPPPGAYGKVGRGNLLRERGQERKNPHRPLDPSIICQGCYCGLLVYATESIQTPAPTLNNTQHIQGQVSTTLLCALADCLETTFTPNTSNTPPQKKDPAANATEFKKYHPKA